MPPEEVPDHPPDWRRKFQTARDCIQSGSPERFAELSRAIDSAVAVAKTNLRTIGNVGPHALASEIYDDMLEFYQTIFDDCWAVYIPADLSVPATGQEKAKSTVACFEGVKVAANRVRLLLQDFQDSSSKSADLRELVSDAALKIVTELQALAGVLEGSH